MNQKNTKIAEAKPKRRIEFIRLTLPFRPDFELKSMSMIESLNSTLIAPTNIHFKGGLIIRIIRVLHHRRLRRLSFLGLQSELITMSQYYINIQKPT